MQIPNIMLNGIQLLGMDHLGELDSHTRRLADEVFNDSLSLVHRLNRKFKMPNAWLSRNAQAPAFLVDPVRAAYRRLQLDADLPQGDQLY
jgi:hypothetical protein